LGVWLLTIPSVFDRTGSDSAIGVCLDKPDAPGQQRLNIQLRDRPVTLLETSFFTMGVAGVGRRGVARPVTVIYRNWM
jgi:hypothetical protein